MAFKSDTIQLKNYSTDPTSASAGELAVVGTSGNRVLKLYDNASWKNLSASTGATQLTGLTDVSASPVTEYHIAQVNDASQMIFGLLTVNNISSGAILIGGETFVNDDTQLMTAAAVEDKVLAEIATHKTASFYSSTITTQLSGNVALPTNSVSKIVMASDPQAHLFTLTAPVASNGWAQGTCIELINVSDYVIKIGRPQNTDTHHLYVTNTNTTLSAAGAEIEIGSGQRALIMPEPTHSPTARHAITILSL